MTIGSIFSDGTSTALLLRVLCYTFFYAALAWLPLRFSSSALARLRDHLSQRRDRDRKIRSKPDSWSVSDSYVR